MNRDRTLPGFLWAVPLLAFVPLAMMAFARTPYFLNDLDPSYFYLSSFLNLNEIGQTYFVDNPGFPVQLFGAWISRLVFFFCDSGGLTFQEHILVHPELYLNWVGAFFLIIPILSVYAIGVGMLRFSDDPALTVLCQLFLILLSRFTLYRFVGVTSEVVMMAATVIAVLMLLFFMSASEESQQESRWAWLFGLSGAVLLICKLTTLPVLAVLFLALPMWRQRLIMTAFVTAIFMASFGILAPSRLSYYLGFVKRIFFHSGVYGDGEAGMSRVEFGLGILRVVKSDPMLVSVWVAMTAMLVILILRSKIEWRSLFSKDLGSRLLFGLFVSISGHFFIVGKQFRQHYLLSACILMLLIIAWLLWTFRSSYRSLWRPYLLACLTVGIAMKTYEAGKILNDTWRVRGECLELIAYADSIKEGHLEISYNTSLTRRNALHWLDQIADRCEVSDMIRTLYPNEVMISEMEELTSLATRSEKPLILISNEVDLESRCDLLTRVMHNDFGAIYRVHAHSSLSEGATVP
jgi:hypothetical protein